MELIDSIKATDIIRGIPKTLPALKGVLSIGRYLINSRKDANRNYPLFFEHMAKRYANNTLIKFHNASYTYREFNERCNQIAHYLEKNGVKSGDVVALYMENRPEYLMYVTAIAKTGATAALINNAQTKKVLLHSINLVSPKAIITGEEIVQAIIDVKDQIETTLPLYIVPNSECNWIKQNPEHDFVDIHTDSQTFPKHNLTSTQNISSSAAALYVYTSGTTGLPKASIQTHGKILKVAFLFGMITSLTKESDTIYCCLPFYHATALYLCWLPTISNGATAAIRRKFSASEFWPDIRRFDATVFIYIGELCRYLLNQEPSTDEKNHNVRMVSGNGLRPDLWDKFAQRFGISNIREFYGSSEGNVTCYNLLAQRQTMGLCLGPYAIVKVDVETEEPVLNENGHLIKTAIGEPGLLLGKITLATAFDGYTDKSKNTSKVISGAFDQNDQWFNTGDMVKNLGFRHLQFVDRTGDTYRWKGENVSTGEVEMIVNTFPGIAECVAYGVEIPNTNGRAGMVAITPTAPVPSVVTGTDPATAPSTALDIDALYSFLKQELPNYAVPIFIRTLGSVDATGTFKYQRNRLKEEGFDSNKFEHNSDAAYAALPGTNTYQLIDTAILDGIKSNQYKF